MLAPDGITMVVKSVGAVKITQYHPYFSPANLLERRHVIHPRVAIHSQPNDGILFRLHKM
jgi:hypothetical protein